MLSVLALGHLTFEQIAPLEPFFSPIEAIDSGLPREVELFKKGAEINRAIAAAANPWVLILRHGEGVDQSLADEIRRSLGDPPQAWGFRVRTQAMYDGKPLMLSTGAGEVRLVHQRHARLREGEWRVEGSVVRLENPLRITTFRTSAEHQEFLRARGVPHSAVRRILLFLRNALATGAWYRSASTLRYLWLEAGYDLEGERTDY